MILIPGLVRQSKKNVWGQSDFKSEFNHNQDNIEKLSIFDAHHYKKIKVVTFSSKPMFFSFCD